MTATLAAVPSSVEPVIIRPARQDEHHFISCQWLRSYEKSPFGKTMKAATVHRQWGPVVTNLLSVGQVLCVCPEDSPEATVYGWMCWEPNYHAEGEPVVHYVHMKAQERRKRYGSRLVAMLPAKFTVSHSTQAMSAILERWAQDESTRSGICYREGCGFPLKRHTSGAEETFRCVRPPRAGHPPCAIEFVRPAGFVAPSRPHVTVDLTKV